MMSVQMLEQVDKDKSGDMSIRLFVPYIASSRLPSCTMRWWLAAKPEPDYTPAPTLL